MKAVKIISCIGYLVILIPYYLIYDLSKNAHFPVIGALYLAVSVSFVTASFALVSTLRQSENWKWTGAAHCFLSLLLAEIVEIIQLTEMLTTLGGK